MGLAIELWESSYSIEGNYSVVGANVVYYGNGVSWNGYGCSGSLSVGGQSVSFSSTFSTSTSRQVLYGTGYFTIYHDSEGKGSVSAYASFVTNVSLGTLEASASIGLTTIPRASSISSFPSSFTTGSLGTISLSRKSSSFKHTVTCKIEGVVNNDGLSKTSDIDDSFTYTPPHSIFADYPTKSVLNAEITIQTKNGTTNIGSAIVRSFTISLVASKKPSLNVNREYIDPFNNTILLQNISKIKFKPVPSMDSDAGGYISSWSISIDNQKVTKNWSDETGADNSWTSDVFSIPGNKIAVATVTDSRGRSATYNIPVIVVTAYSIPTCNISYQQNGSYITLNLSGVYSQVSNNTIVVLDIDYRLQGLTEWTPVPAGSIIANNGTWASSASFEGDIADNIYEIQVTVGDSTTNSITSSVLTGKPLLIFKYGGDDLGVRFTEEEAMNISSGLDCDIEDIKLFPTPIPNYLKFTAAEANTVIDFEHNDTSIEIELEYSRNGRSWTTFTDPITLNAVGDFVYFRGDNDTIGGNSVSVANKNGFTFTQGKVEASGSIMSLLDKTVTRSSITNSYCFNMLFSGCSSLITAPELPATTLSAHCYRNIFSNCTNLTTPPELPATTLVDSCYESMFFHCANLTTPPILPATTLAVSCYFNMFCACTSLATAPELPVTTLVERCYESMFQGCTSLTTPPELPATTLAAYCYSSMFPGCTGLTVPPELPATTLANYCYFYMFEGCTSLIALPRLSAIVLKDHCYEEMFYNCTGIKLSATRTGAYTTQYRIPESGTGTSGTGSLRQMFYGTGGTFTGTASINTTYYTSNQVI